MRVAEGVDTEQVTSVAEALAAQGVTVKALGATDGVVTGADGERYTVDRALPTVAASVLYDAVVLPGGPMGTPATADDPDMMRFVRDAYRHGKPVGALGSGVGLLTSLEAEGLQLSTEFHRVVTDRGVVTDTSPGSASDEFLTAFSQAVAEHRHWGRPPVV